MIKGNEEEKISEENISDKNQRKERKEVSLGTNMFARKDFVSLNNERIVTSRYYFDEKWYNKIDGTEIFLEKLPEEERNLLEEYYNDMKQELAISTSISINNLLK